METNQEAAPVLRDQLPDHAAHLAAEPELAAAWNHEVIERRAQVAKIESLLAYRSRKLESNRGQHTFTRRAAEKAVTRDAATVLGLTEASVRRLLGTAEFLVEKLPKTWKTYRSGLIDRESAVKAAAAVEDIAHREDLLRVIDAEIAQRAPRENAGVVQKWVSGRVAELDAACFQERYDRAQAKRYVSFRHLGNGMSRIEALIPTLVAAQVEQQIYAVARNAPRTLPHQGQTVQGSGGTEDPSSLERTPQEHTFHERTLTQRIADAFIGRLKTGQPHSGQFHADPAQGDPEGAVPRGFAVAGSPSMKIGVLVPVQTLTGDSDAPAISWDRSWSLPAETVRQIALDPSAEHDWCIAGTAQPAQGTGTTGISVSSTAVTGAQPSPGKWPAAEAAPEILTVVRPREGPGRLPLEDWIRGADPQEANLLTRTYQSRTARHRQRDAILLRDGQCTNPGCTNPGWQAEIDHTHSYETGGQTTGENLRVLCRDCHSIKSHRLDHSLPVNPLRSSAGGVQRTGLPGNSTRQGHTSRSAPARASPAVEDLPEWLIETRPPPDWAVEDAA